MNESVTDLSDVEVSAQESRVSERDKLVEASRASKQLDRRIADNKDADILAADADGTLYVRSSGGGIYIGDNRETGRQIAEKNIPFLVNTARPGWSFNEDTDIVENLGLPLPDIVVAGTGGMVYWRNEQGKLVTDPVYLAMLNDHRITVKDGSSEIETPFDTRTIIESIYPTIGAYVEKGLEDVLVDPGAIGTNGEHGVDGIRLVARYMPYDEIQKMTSEIREILSGAKLQLSEITRHSSADVFSGWIHLIPSIAGKDRALRYVLDTLAQAKGTKMTAHALGDTSIDIPVLSMGTPDVTDRYTVKQYALSNLPERARAKLERVSQSKANEAPYNRRLPAHLHLRMLDQAGPDGVAQVVSSLK